MSRTLKDYEPPTRKGPTRKYDTTHWFTGEWVELRKGKDFDCSVSSMGYILRRYVKGKKRIQIYPGKKKDTIIIRVTDFTN